MGASGWSYFVPFRADVAKALADLHADVFRRGEYAAPPAQKGRLRLVTPPRSIRELLARAGTEGTHSILDVERVIEISELERMEHDGKDMQRELYAMLESGAPRPGGRLEAALMASAMRYRARERGADVASPGGVLTPLRPEEYDAILQTREPDHEAVERASSELQTLRGRGNGVYVVVYKDGQPNELFFTGYSGD